MRATQRISFADAPPIMHAPSTRIFLGRPFLIVLAAGERWLLEHSLSAENVGAAIEKALVYSCTDPSRPTGPCAKCGNSEKGPRPLMLLCKQTQHPSPGEEPLPSRTPQPATDPSLPGLLLFNFDHCRSFCSSSRLHYGGNLFIQVRLAGEAIHSQALELCSRTCMKGRSKAAASATAIYQQIASILEDDAAQHHKELRHESDNENQDVDSDKQLVPSLEHVTPPMELQSAETDMNIEAESTSRGGCNQQLCLLTEALFDRVGPERRILPVSITCTVVGWATGPVAIVNHANDSLHRNSKEMVGFNGFYWSFNPATGIGISVAKFRTMEEVHKHVDYLVKECVPLFAGSSGLLSITNSYM